MYFQNKNLKSIAPQPNWDSRGTIIQYNLTLGQPLSTDPSVLWSLTLPVNYSYYTPNYLIIRKQRLVIYGIGDEYINIHLRADGFNGFIN